MKLHHFFVFILLLSRCVFAYEFIHTKEPIDVIIPCIEKDLETLEMCIDSIKSNVIDLRRIIVISKKRLTDKAEWFCEDEFPFNFYSIGKAIYKNDEDKADWFATKCNRRGWIFQQLLKLYAPFVIPGISSNVLCVDSDLIFLKKQAFLTDNNAGLYAYSNEYYKSYFDHMNRLLPKLKKIDKSKSGICHHMLFQREVLVKLFEEIKFYHNTEPWIAFSECIDPSRINKATCSEYEIYFNYLFFNDPKARIRFLKWDDCKNLSNEQLEFCKENNFDYVVFHKWMREKKNHRIR